MKKILAFLVVVGHVLTTVYGADVENERSTFPASEIDSLTDEFRALQSTVQTLQDQVIEHENTAGLSTPPLFCWKFIGDSRVAKVGEIRDMQSKIAYIQNTHDTISDETTKAELAVQLTNLMTTFEDEMEKKSRYESAVKKLLFLNAELNAYSIQIYRIAQKTSKLLPPQSSLPASRWRV
ncbi:hypothetical protein [Candidatus Bodocaedibacter vickermanii]|uniref:Uncharacterized protein n=1 Tax=Candidatus Bodocaedibacter vickermanii TaxID=2741701 RepID=A0A7L9RTF9_9PROT|nr:hypothetical protein CPBP_00671 [Candidatus Paracaedibacteraceae bacterium 'Lake Konstanz']